MLKHLTQSRIAIRLPALVVLSLVACIALSTWIYYSLFRTEIRTRVEQHATAVAMSARNGFTAWLDRMHATTEDLAESHLAPDAMRSFNEALALQAPGWLDDIRQAYVTDNAAEGSARSDLMRGDSRPAYDAIHEEFHPYFNEHLERFAYADLLLISTDGDVLYSNAKGDEFATNLVEGPYANSMLAQVWRDALDAPQSTNASTDVAPYAPDNNAPAVFIARRVIDHEVAGRPVLGVVAIRLSFEAAETALQNAGELHALDEIYLAGADGRTRSAPRLASSIERLSALPDLPQIGLARAGESGYVADTLGIHGRPVVASAISFRAHGAPLSAIVEIDREAAFESLDTFTQRAALFMALCVALSLLVGILVARSITRPLQALSASMTRLAAEDYATPVAAIDRHDEIGAFSRGLDQFRGELSAARDNRALQAETRTQQAQVVEDLGTGLRDLASGQLDKRLTTSFPADYEQLRHDFNATVETMETLMRSISANAGEIRARAEEISASSDDLSHRTENQAATLEQTAAALDELTASVKAAAESASEVESVVADARKEAETSGQVVAEAVAAMSLIRKSSNEISQIIGVIDDIAFQTNLLALNAGVEAARAGDAGRGFAVVASEVRALAQRSSDAAKQIKTLITGSSEQVETGVGLVGRAGETLTMIVERVGNIDQLVVGIAAGAREQSSGLGEINVGVSQLDQVTQQNAAMVEEVTAAAITLKNESTSLNQAVARFRIRAIDAPPEVARVFGDTTPPVEDRPSSAQHAYVSSGDEPALTGARVANMAGWQDF